MKPKILYDYEKLILDPICLGSDIYYITFIADVPKGYCKACGLYWNHDLN